MGTSISNMSQATSIDIATTQIPVIIPDSGSSTGFNNKRIVAALLAGTKWYTGTGIPDNAIGLNGDWYLNSITWDIYQKVSGAWGTSLGVLKGTDGTDGVGIPTGGTSGQVLAKNSGTDYDTHWISSSSNTPVDLSSASSDYSLAVGETAYVNYSNATSVLLHIASVEGLYELDLVGPVDSAQSDIGNMLLPNNASGTAGAFKLVGTRIADTGSVAAYSSLTDMTAFNIGPARMVRSVVHISTQTTSKSVNFSSIIIRTGYTIEQISASSYWTDTTTAWTSLGTVTFNTAQSGKIVVRRII